MIKIAHNLQNLIINKLSEDRSPGYVGVPKSTGWDGYGVYEREGQPRRYLRLTPPAAAPMPVMPGPTSPRVPMPVMPGPTSPRVPMPVMPGPTSPPVPMPVMPGPTPSPIPMPTTPKPRPNAMDYANVLLRHLNRRRVRTPATPAPTPSPAPTPIEAEFSEKMQRLDDPKSA